MRDRWRADLGVALTVSQQRFGGGARSGAGKFQKKLLKTHITCG
jgi:hypothetical protein